ncbi:MAG: AAA family ATPase [Cyclobacteriaceae bacterium]|nr:MAG: AAA family ATPase [Cyclobacteriaceae bacterium]
MNFISDYVFLNNLRLFNFKNHADVNLTFDAPIVCLVGRNGSGKTNVLDAIHYLSWSKSAFNPSDIQNIKHQEAGFFTGRLYRAQQTNGSRMRGANGRQENFTRRWPGLYAVFRASWQIPRGVNSSAGY